MDFKNSFTTLSMEKRNIKVEYYSSEFENYYFLLPQGVKESILALIDRGFKYGHTLCHIFDKREEWQPAWQCVALTCVNWEIVKTNKNTETRKLTSDSKQTANTVCKRFVLENKTQMKIQLKRQKQTKDIFEIPLLVKFKRKFDGQHVMYKFIQLNDNLEVYSHHGYWTKEPLRGVNLEDQISYWLKFLNNNEHIITNNLNPNDYN
jgi:hypothetical protein